jgi:MOSC domain-containing protein YiiM
VKVLTVNVGVPRDDPWKHKGLTGIDKRPVDGPVAVSAPGPKGDGAVGLDGDRVYDVAHHGGTYQAVYAYAREDLDAWEGVLGRSLPNGVFGENLTTEGIDVNGARLGERWRIGESLVLEATGPRVPCATFQGWLDRAGWIKQFTRAVVPGAYFRVVTPGQIRAGDTIAIVRRPDHDVTVGVAFRAFTLEPDLLPQMLIAADALPPDDLELIRRRLQV